MLALGAAVTYWSGFILFQLLALTFFNSVDNKLHV